MPRKKKDDGATLVAPPPPPPTNTDGDGGDDEPKKKAKPAKVARLDVLEVPWGFGIRVSDKQADRFTHLQAEHSLCIGGIAPQSEHSVVWVFDSIQAAHIHAHAIGLRAGEYIIAVFHCGQQLESSGKHEDDDEEDDE